jgi:hypothetical protein
MRSGNVNCIERILLAKRESYLAAVFNSRNYETFSLLCSSKNADVISLGGTPMNLKRKQEKVPVTRRRTRIKTSILELMQELSSMTSDDRLVVAAVKSIFGEYNVRLASAPIPVQLVSTDAPDWTSLKKSRRRKSSR